MLDVHAPEHPIGGVREFFLHLFTITCGLLIALALEDGATALHHRSERREAEQMIHQELAGNLAGAKQAAPLVLKERDALVTLLAFVQARSEGSQAPPPTGISVIFSENEIPDAAWRTASSTGALAYMDYGEVEKLAAAYREQDLLQTTEQQALRDLLQMGSFLNEKSPAGSLNQARATAALPYVRAALADLNGVLDVGEGTLQAYQEALK